VTAPTFSQIKAQVSAIRQRDADAKVIGIRSQGRWTGERLKQEGSEVYLIEQCDSPLAVRLALREFHSSEAAPNTPTIKVLLTGLDEAALGDDILLRLVGRRLYLIDGWQIVKTLFQATSIDPRLIQASWIADFLMEWVPSTGYSPVSSGFLDAETVWSILLSKGIDLTAHPPDLLTILKWSTDADSVAKLKSAPSKFCESAVAWLTTVAGLVVQSVLHCALNSERPDALPVGIVLEVLFHQDAEGKLDRAVGKLEERYFGGATIKANTVSRWSQAATDCLQQLEPAQRHQLLERADQILQEVGAESFAYLGDSSLVGFEQRLSHLGRTLVDSLKAGKSISVEDIDAGHKAVLSHSRAQVPQERRRLIRLHMAIRLARWLAHQADTPARSLAETIAYHQTEGGFVDWARLSLQSGDQVRELSEAFTILFEQTTAIREQQALQFATLLQNWTEVGSTQKTVLPVEAILKTVVAPLAAQAPVLVIVMDGMSMAACRELLADITAGQQWICLCQEQQTSSVAAGLATIPSITETSRTSLLCGQLKQGKAADEKKGFAALPALLAECRSSFPPVLFHKDALRQQDSILADGVRAAITSTQNQVIGVVVNAIDDYLAKGEQIDIQWSQDAIKLLTILLHEAKSANRLVILLSDHGHVLDHQTVKMAKQPLEGGARWRFAAGNPEVGELQISGSRVLSPDSNTVIAPWTERLRYRSKNNGYHGGISPQEMVVPIAVLTASNACPAGWIEARDDTPFWWNEEIALLQNSSAATSTPQPIQQNAQLSLGPLFESANQVKAAPKPSQPAKWLLELFASPLYKSRKKVAGRSVPGDDVLAKVLLSLDSSGGSLNLNALARIIQYPATHTRSTLIVIQRILNVDGYVVVMFDPTSNTVKLDRELLYQQFSLKH
jgi:hypothetical protein